MKFQNFLRKNLHILLIIINFERHHELCIMKQPYKMLTSKPHRLHYTLMPRCKYLF